jgi:hypothetical protein
MYKKHLTVLPMFRDIVGAEKRVAELRQADVNEFLSIVERLPPRWKDEARRRRMTVRDLAEVVHAKTMSPKSFDDTYKASIRAFLKVARTSWSDPGFPGNAHHRGH